MSDTREINIAFNAETKTAQQNAATLTNALQSMQNRAERNRDALRGMTNELDNAFAKLANSSSEILGNESAANVFSKEIDKAQNLAGNAEDKLQGVLGTIAGLKKELSAEGIDNSFIDSLKPRLEQLKADLDRIVGATVTHTDSLSALTNALLETQQALTDGGISPHQAEALSKLNAEILKTGDLLRELQAVGGESIIAPDGTLRSLDELAKTLAKLKAAKDAVSEGDTSAWQAKWASDTKDATDKIVAAYDKAAAGEEAAHARAEAAAEKKLDRINQANELEAAGIAELTAKLEELTAAREAAQQEGDKIAEAGLAEQIKATTAELERKQQACDRAAAAAQRAAATEEAAARATANAAKRSSEQATQAISNIARGAATGTLTMRGFAASFRGLGKAIRAGLGPLLWGVLLFEALILAAEKAWQAIRDWWNKSAKAAEESAERQKKAAEELSEAQNKVNDTIADKERETALREQLELTIARTRELDAQIEREKRVLNYLTQQMSIRMDKEDMRHRIELAKLNGEYAGKEKDEAYYARQYKLEDDHTRRKRALEDEQYERENEAAQKNYEAELLKYSTLNKTAKNYEELIAGLRSDEQRTRDWTHLKQLRERRDHGEISSTGRSELARLEALDEAEAALMEKLGFWKLALTADYQSGKGESNFANALQDELNTMKEQLAEIDKNARDISERRESAAMEYDARRSRRGNEDFLTETTRRGERTARESKAAEKAEKEAKTKAEKEAKTRQAARDKALSIRKAYISATQNYRGKGAKLLSIFADGKISQGEMDDAYDLNEIARQNKELKKIIDTLLDIAESNAKDGSKGKKRIQDLQLDLSKEKKHARILRSSVRR